MDWIKVNVDIAHSPLLVVAALVFKNHERSIIYLMTSQLHASLAIDVAISINFKYISLEGDSKLSLDNICDITSNMHNHTIKFSTFSISVISRFFNIFGSQHDKVGLDFLFFWGPFLLM